MLRMILPLLFLVSSTQASLPDWSEGTPILTPRTNPYELTPENYLAQLHEGRLHTLEYPVDISGVLVPWKPFSSFLDNPQSNPIRALLQTAFEGFSKIRSTDDLFSSIGLHSYPSHRQTGKYDIPFRGNEVPKVRMGVTVFKRENIDVFTLSCAACHSANLFGTKVLGMTNRFPQSNEFFVLGKKAAGLVGPGLFRSVLGATREEAAVYERLKDRVKAVGAKKPIALGLDTSLAQVALSLARRAPDAYASFDTRAERNPREEILEKKPADSKPAVWWNLKYKNRWLSDGSVVSGNPIYTNILWNEIGRGTDLKELEVWLKENDHIIQELTTAVFSTEAPRYVDFFPAERIDLARAKRGEKLFIQNCAGCHGRYEKKWSLPNAESLSLREQYETLQVNYHAKTPVIDVGTDPHRYHGMKSLEQLNDLTISKTNGVVIRTQKGYVPPPLVGIWARWPYFHNNSAPSLCAVLSKASDRPTTYYAGEALDPMRDFDDECNGYPTGNSVPAEWKRNTEKFYDTRKVGMGNSGHEIDVTNEERKDLIQFLKTL